MAEKMNGMTKLGKWLVTALVCSAAIASQLSVAWGQYPSWKGKEDDYPTKVSYANNYIHADVGTGGIVQVYMNPDKTFSPNEQEWQVNGRWDVVSVIGDPESSADDNRELIYFGQFWPAHYFGYWKVRIGDVIRVVGDTSTGYWIKSPTVHEQPTPGLAEGIAGGFIESIWSTTGSDGTNVSIRIRMAIVRDTVRFEYQIQNNGTATQSIGLTMCGDVEVADPNAVSYYYDNLNFPFLKGTGAVLPNDSARALCFGKWTDTARRSTELPSVPDRWEIYDDIVSPGTVARNILGEADATKPDFAAIGQYGELYDPTTWPSRDYNPDPLDQVIDAYWVLTWEPRSVAGSQHYTLVTYYGIGAAETQWTNKINNTVQRDSVALAVESPKSLQYNTTQDLAENNISPAEFDIKAYVYNLATDPGPYVLEDATASIYLPAGLELVEGSIQQQIGRVDINSEPAPVDWKVRATGEYCGNLEYRVAVSDTTGWHQTVAGNIIVPATKNTEARFGWQLMHVPFTFDNFAIGHVFGLDAGTYGAKYWNAKTQKYEPVVQVTPGQSFWMFTGGLSWGDVLPLEVADDAAIVGCSSGKQLYEQHIQLYRGWNMIGNPFLYPVYWGAVDVYEPTSNSTVTLDSAVDKKWLSKTIFTWNPDKWAYDYYRDNDTLLNPWQGYWINAKKPVTLVLRPPSFPESDVTTGNDGR